MGPPPSGMRGARLSVLPAPLQGSGVSRLRSGRGRKIKQFFSPLSRLAPVIARLFLNRQRAALRLLLGLPILARLLGFQYGHRIAVHVRFESG